MFRRYHGSYGGYPGYSGIGGGTRRRRDPRGDQLMYLLITLFHRIYMMEHKPPVTLFLIGVNVALFFKPRELPGIDLIPSLQSGCLHPRKILARKEWHRLLWFPILHYDYAHLYYNILSLLWKGSQLEPRMGSVGFGGLILELGFVSGMIHLAGAALLAALSPKGIGQELMNQCSIGFSGILFGLKVVLTHDQPGWSNVFGISLPTKYTAWLELIVAQMLTPGVSFMGHLSGVIAGVLHVVFISKLWRKLLRRYRTTTTRHRGSSSYRQPRFYGHGRVGRQ